jgi:hypothetical protein
MTRVGIAAVFVVLCAAVAEIVAITRSDDPFAPIAVGVVALLSLGVLLAIYVFDAIFRAGKAARDITRDDRQV